MNYNPGVAQMAEIGLFKSTGPYFVRVCGFLTPIFTDKLQGLNAEEITTAQAMPSLICIVAIILTNLFCLIWGLMLAKKDPGVETSLIG